MNQSLAGSRSAEFFAGVYELLALQVKRYHSCYHMGDNTSVPEETAKALMDSLWYTLEKADASTPAEALALGQQILKDQTEEAKKLLLLVRATAPDFASEWYHHTLETLDRWLRGYDWEHFAHQTPVFLEYPLLSGEWENLRGIDRVLLYLKCLWQENQILAAPVDFEAGYPPETWDIPTNLCRQPLMDAVTERLADCPPGPAVQRLEKALEKVLTDWNVRSPDAAVYAGCILPELLRKGREKVP